MYTTYSTPTAARAAPNPILHLRRQAETRPAKPAGLSQAELRRLVEELLG